MDWLEDFRRRWEANEARRKSPLDPDWSVADSYRCEFEAEQLIREIVVRLSMLPILPADLFDRPELVQLIEAAKVAVGKP